MAHAPEKSNVGRSGGATESILESKAYLGWLERLDTGKSFDADRFFLYA
jgi:hypothetical protein